MAGVETTAAWRYFDGFAFIGSLFNLELSFEDFCCRLRTFSLSENRGCEGCWDLMNCIANSGIIEGTSGRLQRKLWDVDDFAFDLALHLQ